VSDEVIAKLAVALVFDKITGGTVYLNSPGGNLLSGIELGRLIRKNGLSTQIGKKGEKYGTSTAGECYSSCVLAYIGGNYRFEGKDARIGVHRFSTQTPTTGDLAAGQIVSAAITSYLSEMGIDVGLFNRMSQAGSNEILLLSAAERRAFRVVNDGILPAIWSLHSEQEFMYLKGAQEKSTGSVEIIFQCSKF